LADNFKGYIFIKLEDVSKSVEKAIEECHSIHLENGSDTKTLILPFMGVDNVDMIARAMIDTVFNKFETDKRNSIR
jgi:hypothetical protein